jgi:hypothetical protein
VAQVRTDFPLEITVDMVLRGQGADPVKVRARKPVLVDLAEQAIHKGSPYIKPIVVSGKYSMDRVSLDGIQLEHGTHLNGTLISEHLTHAEQVVIAICTIGMGLEKTIISTANNGDVPLSLALDGLANAAVDCLSLKVCQQIEADALKDGLHTTIALGPGMLGWPLEIGQPQIFHLLQPDESIVQLLPSMLMIPRKSSSMLIGVGSHVQKTGQACQYCAVNGTCRYHQEIDN